MKEVDASIFMIAASTESFSNIYLTKSSGTQSASKKNSASAKTIVKREESSIKVSNANHSVIATSLKSSTQVNILYGSIFAVKKSIINLINE